MAWAVRGCHAWQQRGGLDPPKVVTDATQEYEADSDPLAGFLAEAAKVDTNAEVGASDLYAHYLWWADQHKLSDRERLTATAFGRKMSARYPKVRTMTGTVYQGLSRKNP